MCLAHGYALEIQEECRLEGKISPQINVHQIYVFGAGYHKIKNFVKNLKKVIDSKK